MRFAALALLCVVPTLYGSPITLSFASLPSAQGWTYVSEPGGLPEATAFAVDGSTLYQDTMGGGGGVQYYVRHDVTDSPFVLAVRARVLAEELGTFTNAFGLAFGLTIGLEQFAFGLGAGRITLDTAAGSGGLVITSVDTSVFHDYQIVGAPGGTYDFLVDGVLLADDVAPYLFAGGVPDRLGLGDGTGGPNARGEITSFEYRAVPEPATLLLVGFGLLTGAGFSQRTRR